MARDTDPIAEDLTPGTATPDPETSLEALLRAYNRQPRDTDLADGDLWAWNAATGNLEGVGRDTYVADGGVDTLANRPAASPDNAGTYYTASNVGGGTLYRSNGTSWVQVAAGVATERVRVRLSGRQWETNLGSAVRQNTTFPKRYLWTFPKSPSQVHSIVADGIEVPDHWATFDLYLPLVNLSAGAGAGRFRIDYGLIADGDLITEALTNAGALDWTAGAQNTVDYTQIVSGLTAPSVGESLAIEVQRQSNSGNDTLDGDIAIEYVDLVRAS